MSPAGPLFDVFIIGAGQAGIPLAHALAKTGKRVAVAERKDLGGSCVNFGCTPTKAAISSARAAYLARRAAVFGLRVPKVEVDFPAVLDRARSILMQSRASIRRSFEKVREPSADSGTRAARRTGRRALPRARRAGAFLAPDTSCSIRARAASSARSQG